MSPLLNKVEDFFLCVYMAQPASRAELKDYCLRLDRPILEINVDDDQIDDLIDDAIQMFNERIIMVLRGMFLKHQFTADDKTRLQEVMRPLCWVY